MIPMARNGPTTKRLQVTNEEEAEGLAIIITAPRVIRLLLQSASQAGLAKVAESAPTSALVALGSIKGCDVCTALLMQAGWLFCGGCTCRNYRGMFILILVAVIIVGIDTRL